MGFCPNCGNQIADGGKFCQACGTAIGAVNAPAGNANAAVGMQSVTDVQNFYRNTLQFKEKYVKQYTTGINMLINSLMPGETIEFATHCVIGGLKGGTAAEIATTNRRFIVANTPSSSTRMTDSLHLRRRSQIENYRYDTFSGINCQNGLLLGNVKIDFIDGSINIGVDKKWTQIVYKGLSASFYQHTNGGF